MSKMTRMVSLLLVLSTGIVIGMVLRPATADDTPKPAATAPAPIRVTGEEAQKLKDAFTNLQFASQQYQLTVTQAKYNLSIPKGYEFNIGTFTFDPPIKPPEAKP